MYYKIIGIKHANENRGEAKLDDYSLARLGRVIKIDDIDNIRKDITGIFPYVKESPRETIADLPWAMHTSKVVDSSYIYKGKYLVIETENTIYELELYEEKETLRLASVNVS